MHPHQTQEDALPLSQATLNVGVDLAVLVACIWAWNFENKLKQQTNMCVRRDDVPWFMSRRMDGWKQCRDPSH